MLRNTISIPYTTVFGNVITMLHYRDSIVMNYFTTQKIQTKHKCVTLISQPLFAS